MFRRRSGKPFLPRFPLRRQRDWKSLAAIFFAWRSCYGRNRTRTDLSGLNKRRETDPCSSAPPALHEHFRRDGKTLWEQNRGRNFRFGGSCKKAEEEEKRVSRGGE